MAVKNTRAFRDDVDNVELFNAIKRTLSPDFQVRIPDVTQATIKDAMAHMYNNVPFWNEFENALFNRIGMEIYIQKNWTNPLSIFKRGKLEFGDTIEEVFVDLIKQRVYEPDREYLEKDLFGTHKAPTHTRFHKINRRGFYPVTVDRVLLKDAFNSPRGLTRYIQQVMQSPQNSAQYDEFMLTANLFKEMWEMGGIFNVQSPDVGDAASDDADAKILLRQIREKAGVLPFMSRRYNAAGVHSFANPEDLVLIGTAEAMAAIDVNALAAAFNLDKATVPAERKITLPSEHFDIPGVQAILTTPEALVIVDSDLETTSEWNAITRRTNYFLHHHQVLSVSPFAPMIAFSTNPDTEIVLVSDPVTSVEEPEVSNKEFEVVTEVERGEKYAVESMGITTPPGGLNSEVTYELTGGTSERTYVTQYGVVYVGVDETATELTITATSTETADGDPISNSATVTVTGEVLQVWPNPDVLPAPTDPDD